MKEWITTDQVDEDGLLPSQTEIKRKIRYWLNQKEKARTPSEARYANLQLTKLYDLER